jgi:hypothetical protein
MLTESPVWVSKGEGGRVVAQGDPLQCAEGITRGQCPRENSGTVRRKATTAI